MSKFEEDLASRLENAGISFRRGTDVPSLPYDRLYGVKKTAIPDFYLPHSGIFIEVKGQMTLHQVSKMLFLAEHADVPYYVAQYSEEDWDPTVESLVEPFVALPDSIASKKRKQANVEHQVSELLALGTDVSNVDAKRINRATAARLRAYVRFFHDHLVRAGSPGLLAGAV